MLADRFLGGFGQPVLSPQHFPESYFATLSAHKTVRLAFDTFPDLSNSHLRRTVKLPLIYRLGECSDIYLWKDK